MMIINIIVFLFKTVVDSHIIKIKNIEFKRYLKQI